MKWMKRWPAVVLALMLAFGLASVAQADTTVKSSHGAFAAVTQGRIYMILPTDSGSTLFSMPEQGGAVTEIESAPQINDLISTSDGSVYYLRYTGAAFEAVVRKADGSRTTLASFTPGQIVYSLSSYEGALYCLADNMLTRIDLNGAGAQAVSSRQIGAYTIADGIVYYQSREDEASYSKTHTSSDGAQGTVTTAAGRLYAMNLDGSNDMRQFDQGVSNLAAYGEYIYFHNYNDSYVVDGSPDAWLDGKLYRLNVQTNQFKLLRDGYDWNYRPVDLGLVIYQQKSLTISTQDGADPVLLYEPDPYNYLVLLDDYALVYEYNLQKLTRVPYDKSGAVQLWSGAFVTDGTNGGVVDTDTGSQSSSSQTAANSGAQTTGSQTTIQTSSSQKTTSNASSDSGSLKYGSTGERVREMQKRLKELGYLSYVDGIFGDKTLTAVKRFQRAAGLTVDGIAGTKTLARLNRSDAPEYDGTTATDSSYIFANSSKKKLTRDDVLSINKSLWPYARNEIYARHGYSFKDSQYREYFENKTWYKEGGFSTSDLSEIEWYNMELILAMEKEYANSSSGSSSNSSGGSSGSTTSDDYIFPNSSTRKLTKAEIREVDSDLWEYGRNEIYARHGYKFTKSKFKNYFSGKSWYKAGGFSTSDLNEIEWYNMELIRWMEENEG